MKPEDFGITNYHWVDGFLNVEGNVDLKNKNLTEIPFKFGAIDGYFSCASNQLTNLKNSPHTITKDFNCCLNQIASLEDGPCHVGGNYDCSYNQLSSIKGIPCNLNILRCHYNKITEITVNNKIKSIFASDNQITKIDVNFNELENLAIWNNPLKHIENLTKVNHLFLDSECLISFKNIIFDFIEYEHNRFYNLEGYHRRLASKKIIQKLKSI